MPEKRTPNILWICSDQQRWDTLGCNGNEFVKTPNIDRLAASGTLFNHAFSQHPMCTPSRASFLTGRYPRTTRCVQNGQVGIPEDEVLITRILAEAGYECGLSGKLHLSPCNPKVAPDMERRINDGYTTFHWSHHSGPGWDPNEYEEWMREKGYNWPSENHPECEHVKIGIPEEAHQTTWCAEKAIDFIKDRKDTDQPWLFSVNMFDPHAAFDPPADFLKRYEEMIDEIPLPNCIEGEWENKPLCQRGGHGPTDKTGRYATDKMSDKDHKYLRSAYWAMCDLIDTQVGRMVDALEETGQLENTIVIFMSDHGEMLGDHGRYLKGNYFYDCAVRVPLIISWPGKIKQVTSSAMVELTDITQTLLDALGMEYHPGMQGQSLWPILSGNVDPDTHREDIYCESYFGFNEKREEPKEGMTMIRSHEYKLVVDHTNDFGELYDLKNDPSETYNLWDDPEHASAKSDMLLRMAHRMAETSDPLPEVISPW